MQRVLDVLVQLRVAGHLHAMPRRLVRRAAPVGDTHHPLQEPRPCLPLERCPAVPWSFLPKTPTSHHGVKNSELSTEGDELEDKNFVSTLALSIRVS